MQKIPARLIRRRSRLPSSPISEEEETTDPEMKMIRRRGKIPIHPISKKEEEERMKKIRATKVYKRRKKIKRRPSAKIHPISTATVEESEEEVITERDEVDWGCDYLLKDRKEWTTVTRPEVPLRYYFKRDGIDGYPLLPVLYDRDHPLTLLAELALHTYNTIENTHYEYVGLVKAYNRVLQGFRFWIRFKARVPGQDDAINFQAILFHGLTHPFLLYVDVDVEFVYPLPT